MFKVTPVYERLLTSIYQLQLLTALQVTRLHYRPGTIKTVKARLKVLTDQGLLAHDTVPTRAFRSPYYYQLTDKGMRYLSDLGYDTQEVARPRDSLHGSLFIDHSLELNDVLISALLLKGATYLDTFRHDQTLKRTPYRAQLPDGRKFTIVPDAFLDFRVKADGKQLRLPILLEHDRGTEQQQYFRRRIRAYITFLRTGDYGRLFDAKSVTVAFTTFCGEARRDQLRAWTRAEVGSDPVGQFFSFASLPRPPSPQCWLDACWHSPYDEVQALLVA